MMNMIEEIKARKSVRTFDGRMIDEEIKECQRMVKHADIKRYIF